MTQWIELIQEEDLDYNRASRTKIAEIGDLVCHRLFKFNGNILKKERNVGSFASRKFTRPG